MQLGTRWSAGTTPPAAVPDVIRAAIVDVETVTLTPDAPAPRWTLTWLEGRPVAELDTGVFVRLTADGDVVVEHDPEDEFG